MLELLYVATLVLLAAYGINSLLLTAIYLLRPRRVESVLQSGPPSALPMVTVQLPIFNERCVVERLLGAVGALDYPRGCVDVCVVADCRACVVFGSCFRPITDGIAAKVAARYQDAAATFVPSPPALEESIAK